MLRRIIVPLLAIVLAGAAAMYARALVEGQKNEIVATASVPEPVVTLSVLVADAPLQTGSFVKPNMLRWQEWPEVDLPNTYLVRGAISPSDLEGGVVRKPFQSGQPIIKDDIVMPGDRGFLAAVLDPGKRAISVPVDEASSHAGLIFPGDRVDLILTQTLQDQVDEAGRQRRAAETVLIDVRVIAMGRALSVDPDEVASGSSSQIRTATLEVSPSEAEIVALVAEMGKLSLSLRSLANDSGPRTFSTESPRLATWDEDVSSAIENAEGEALSLRIIRPTGVEETSAAVPGAPQ